jgi:methyltransferase (TIGR00027 family)
VEANRASRSALNVAIARALHYLYDDEPKIFVDPIGARLAGETDPVLFEARRDVRTDSMQMLARSGNVVRSRFTEDDLARAAASGVRQYVILGAGLDTFAFRQPEFGSTLQIFEVDHPTTQAWKRERVSAMGLVEPPNLHWAPVDFERQGLADGLAAAGFDASRATYVSWLGVTAYLSLTAIDATLKVVAALPLGSSVTLSFVLPDEDLTGLDLENVRSVARRAAEAGEPYLSRFRPEELRAHLSHDLGFSTVFHLTPAEATARYLSGRRDGLTAPRWMQVMTATV